MIFNIVPSNEKWDALVDERGVDGAVQWMKDEQAKLDGLLKADATEGVSSGRGISVMTKGDDK